MSDTFIPTTDAVRTCFGIGVDEALAHFDGEEQFDRWLAAHDAEVRADEREQAEQRVLALGASSRWSVPLLLMVKRAAAAARGEDTSHA